MRLLIRSVLGLAICASILGCSRDYTDNGTGPPENPQLSRLAGEWQEYTKQGAGWTLNTESHYSLYIDGRYLLAKRIMDITRQNPDGSTTPRGDWGWAGRFRLAGATLSPSCRGHGDSCHFHRAYNRDGEGTVGADFNSIYFAINIFQFHGEQVKGSRGNAWAEYMWCRAGTSAGASLVAGNPLVVGNETEGNDWICPVCRFPFSKDPREYHGAVTRQYGGKTWYICGRGTDVEEFTAHPELYTK